MGLWYAKRHFVQLHRYRSQGLHFNYLSGPNSHHCTCGLVVLEGSEGMHPAILVSNAKHHGLDIVQSYRSALDCFDFIDEKVSYSLAGDRAVCHWQLAKIQFEKRDFREAQLTLNSAMNYALISGNTEFYYRLLEDQSWAQLQSDNEILALRVCNDAIEKYEESEDKPFGSYIYCGFLMQKAIILVVFELWKEALDTLEKFNSIDDYLVSMNRVVRIEALRAKALHGLGRIDESLETLNATLSEATEEVVSDDDIADCYALRGQILLSRNDRSGVADLNKARIYYVSYNQSEKENEIVQLLKD